MKEVLEYNDKINCKELKQYALLYKEELNKTYNLSEKITFLFKNSRSNSNGKTFIKKNLDNIPITIYLKNLINSDLNRTNILFNTYCTMTHEVQHAITFSGLSDERNYTYQQLLSALEYIHYARLFKVDVNDIKINVLDTIKLKKIMNKNYNFSLPEINANLIAYKAGLNKFKNYFNEEEFKTKQTIISSLEFLDKNMEIYYDQHENPINKFALFLHSASNYIKKDRTILERFNILKIIFDDNGNIINIYSLYKNINKDNEVMIRRLITSHLVSFQYDYSIYFKDEKFKKYIESCIKEYINNTIEFQNNLDLGKIFVEDTKILKDNLIYKYKAVSYLNNIIHKNNLDSIECTIYNSSIMTLKKKLF